MPSFDVVSRIDLQEVDNALNQTRKEVAQRYDLKDSKTEIIGGETYDVFGDGTVVIMNAPGHTPGHQILYLKLAQTGDVILSGDLYHFKEARELKRVPTFDFDPTLTPVSREKAEAFLATSGAQLWIQHDSALIASLKKAPEYYE